MKRLVLIGYGDIASKHIPAFRALGCEIVASCNRSTEKNALAQTEGKIPMVYTDYHQMIKETKPDGIILTVSFWNIYEILKSILPYQIPVLTEKPSGTSLTEHLDLIERVNFHKTPVMVGLNRRHYSVINKGIAALGGADKISTVMMEWSENPIYLKNGRGFSDELIKKRIFENIHGLDMLTYIAGPVKDYTILTNQYPGDYRWVMNLNGKSERGVIVNFNSSWDNHVPFRIALYSEGMRAIFAPIEKCLVGNAKETWEILPNQEDVDFKPGFYQQAKTFITGNYKNYSLESASNSMQLAQTFFDSF